MSEENIDIRIRIRDAARANAELRLTSEEVKHLGKELRKTKKEAVEASGALALLQTVAGKSQSSVGGLRGSIVLVGAAIAVLSPIILALAGSLGAALGGALAVATGGVFALGVGFGGIAAVAVSALGGIKKVKTALDAYNLAVATHGKYSKEAADAQTKLNAVVGKGGYPILQLIRHWRSLSKEFKAGTGPGRAAIFGIAGDLMGSLHTMMPMLTSEANKDASAFRSALVPFFDALSSPQGQATLVALGDIFRNGIGPWVETGTNFLMGLANIAVASGPYVQEFALYMRDLSKSFLAVSSDRGQTTKTIGGLVDHFKAWAALIGSVTRLIFHLFGATAGKGKNLVVSMTHIVQKWDEWVKSAKGQKKLNDMVDDAVGIFKILWDTLKLVLKVTTPLRASLRWLVENMGGFGVVVLTAVGSLKAFRLLLRTLGITKLIGWLIDLKKAYVLATGAQEASMLMAIRWKAATIGSAIMSGISSLIGLIGRLRGAMVTLAASTAIASGPMGLGGLLSKSMKFLKFAGPLAIVADALINADTAGQTPEKEHAMLRAAKAHAKNYKAPKHQSISRDTIFNGVSDDHKAEAIRTTVFNVGGVEALAPGTRKWMRQWLKTHGETAIPGLASGGTVLSSGWTRVGERGPEILNLPRGASVQPMRPSVTTPSIRHTDASRRRREEVRTMQPIFLHAEFIVDKKKLGEVTIEHIEEVLARQ